MRCYEVRAPGALRYASTQADARAVRDQLMLAQKVKKNQTSIIEVDVSLAKEPLLDFINSLAKLNDWRPEMDVKDGPHGAAGETTSVF